MLVAVNEQHPAHAVRIARVVYEPRLVAFRGRVDHFEFVDTEHVAADTLEQHDFV